MEPVRLINGHVPLVRLTMNDGTTVGLCNEVDAVWKAVKAGRTFQANEALGGYQQAPILVNPAHIALVRSTRNSE